MPINELRSIATFVKTAELGSLRQAAAAQGMTPQAASQALAQLEKHLGVRLFHRTTRSMSLTDEGRHFLEAAQAPLLGMQQALETTRQAKDGIAGPLRVVGPLSVFAPVLWPLLDTFCRRYPEVQPDVQLDDRIGNWVEDRVDVGFRAGSPPGEGLIARHLLPLQLIVCAAPSYLKRFGAPQSIDELARHRCSGFRRPNTGKLMPWEFQVGDEIVARDIASVVLTNDVELEANAVVAGQCVGQLVGPTAAPLIRAGAVVPLLTQHVCAHLGLYIYYGSRVAQPARVRAFLDLAVQRVAGNPAWVLSAQELKRLEPRR